LEPRQSVAKEAARLIYIGAYEEYKQAKEAAARSLGVSPLPSNYEVALELDDIAEREEGLERTERLARMREVAQEVMRAVRNYSPVLTGSVWRGTARKGSDIDINVYATESGQVNAALDREGLKVSKSEEVVASTRGQAIRSVHLTLKHDDFVVELVVRPLNEREEPDRCEIYGDLKRGLTLPELEKLMKTDPLRKFVPRRRYR
jgi:predicted nucleotidyltransferase